jgi:hypothetical protein
MKVENGSLRLGATPLIVLRAFVRQVQMSSPLEREASLAEIFFLLHIFVAALMLVVLLIIVILH